MGRALLQLVRVLVLVAAVGCPVVGVAAQQIGPAPMQLAGAGAPPSEREAGDLRSGHGWVVLWDGEGRDGELFHIPPLNSTRKITAASLRLVTPLRNRPDLAAAGGDHVYMAFGPRIGSVRVLRINAPGGWEYLPVGDVAGEPPLPEGATPISMACGPTPLVLARTVSGAIELFALADDGWARAALPPGVDPSRVMLLSAGDGFRLLEHGRPGAEVRMWGGSLKIEASAPATEDRTPEPARASVTWTKAESFTLPSELVTAEGRSPPWRAAMVDQRIVIWVRLDDGLHLWTVAAGAAQPLATLADAPAAFTLAPVWGAGTVRVYWITGNGAAKPQVGPAGRSAIDPRTVQVREVSATTGRVLFSGGLSVGGAISRNDFTLLAFGFAAAMAAALIFIIRGDQKLPIVLPEGAALAPPGRRLIAWVLDLTPALIASGAVFNLSPAGVIATVGTNEGGSGMLPLAVAVALAILHTGISESLWGRSLGKFVMGLDVVQLRRKPAPPGGDAAADGPVEPVLPGLWPAMVRSAVRFGLAPLAGLLLLDPNWRHPADFLCRTVVIERALPDEDDEL